MNLLVCYAGWDFFVVYERFVSKEIRVAHCAPGINKSNMFGVVLRFRKDLGQIVHLPRFWGVLLDELRGGVGRGS